MAHILEDVIQRINPGIEYKTIFQNCVNAYKKAFYDGEWENHFQGRLTAYARREIKLSMTSKGIVKNNQAFAWNPTIQGTKSKDTILLSQEHGREIITDTGRFPYIEINIDGGTYRRPAILQI